MGVEVRYPFVCEKCGTWLFIPKRLIVDGLKCGICISQNRTSLLKEVDVNWFKENRLTLSNL